jgi:hypothetical protein
VHRGIVLRIQSLIEKREGEEKQDTKTTKSRRLHVVRTRSFCVARFIAEKRENACQYNVRFLLTQFSSRNGVVVSICVFNMSAEMIVYQRQRYWVRSGVSVSSRCELRSKCIVRFELRDVPAERDSTGNAGARCAQSLGDGV